MKSIEEAKQMIISGECWGKESTECNFYMNNDGLCGECLYTTILEALEKQIPRKPIYDDGDYYCAECEEKLETYLYSRCISYCSGCGRAHDWSEVE